jgi:hypothetical protein
MEPIRQVREAVRESTRASSIFGVGLATSVVLNLVGGLAAPAYLHTWFFAAGGIAAVVSLLGFTDALLDNHHLRVRVARNEVDIKVVSEANVEVRKLLRDTREDLSDAREEFAEELYWQSDEGKNRLAVMSKVGPQQTPSDS